MTNKATVDTLRVPVTPKSGYCLLFRSLRGMSKRRALRSETSNGQSPKMLPEAPELLTLLSQTQNLLARVGRKGETAIECISHIFRVLAEQSGAVLKGAGAIVACVNVQRASDVLDAVESLCRTVT